MQVQIFLIHTFSVKVKAPLAHSHTLALAKKMDQPDPKPRPKRFMKNQISESILNDAALNSAIPVPPSNYNFEIHECVLICRSSAAKRVALQFPEDLLMCSPIISYILQTFTSVTYGACYVDDLRPPSC